MEKKIFDGICRNNTPKIFWAILLIFGVFLGVSSIRAQCAPQERIIIEGRLIELKHPIALVRGDDGKHYRIRLGPYWYWKRKGYKLSPGDRVRILGLKKGKLIFPITIESEGREYFIRDECGIPFWRKRP